MKSNSYLIKFCISVIGLFFSITAFAQNPNKLNSISELYTTWYEWPHETHDSQTTFKTTKYVPVPGIDKQEAPFDLLQFNSDGSCIVTKYCGYCPDLVIEKKYGTFELIYSGEIVSSIKITLAQQDSINQIKVGSLASEKLVLDISQLQNKN